MKALGNIEFVGSQIFKLVLTEYMKAFGNALAKCMKAWGNILRVGLLSMGVPGAFSIIRSY